MKNIEKLDHKKFVRNYNKVLVKSQKKQIGTIERTKKCTIQQNFYNIIIFYIIISLAIKVIIDCRTTSAHKVSTRLGFKQYDVILTKEQSMLIKIMSLFEEKICKHNIML